MRMSCNGCRVLRKGCSDNCSIRPCIQWIKSPEAQANATVFLAKFYGRAGLINLVTAGPEHLRPAIFRSLLYEACGRVVNPIYGSVGLLWSGNWKFCQDAVEAVLKGAPVVQIPSESAACPVPPLKAYDIRHVSKEDHSASQDLHRVKTRPRFKRSAAKSKPAAEPAAAEPAVVWNLGWRRCYPDGFERAASHDSTLSHQSESKADTRGEADSMGSMETMSHGGAGEPAGTDESAVELELTLGFDRHPSRPHASPVRDRCKMELGLDLPA